MFSKNKTVLEWDEQSSFESNYGMQLLCIRIMWRKRSKGESPDSRVLCV